MVANVLHMEPQALLDTLRRIRREHADTPEYQELRQGLPDEWPI